MPFIKVEKEKGTCTKVDKTDKGWLRSDWFTDWLSGVLWKKVNKEKGTCTKVDKGE